MTKKYLKSFHSTSSGIAAISSLTVSHRRTNAVALWGKWDQIKYTVTNFDYVFHEW